MDGDQEITTRPAKRILKWLAPVSATLTLAFLVARVSDCHPAEEETLPWLTNEPPPPGTPRRPDLLKGTKSFGVDALPGERSTSLGSEAPEPPQGVEPRVEEDTAFGLEELMGGSLSGSKSGFGGLGLRGPGRVQGSDAGVISLGDLPARGKGAPRARNTARKRGEARP